MILMLSNHLLVERCEKINGIVASFNTGIAAENSMNAFPRKPD